MRALPTPSLRTERLEMREWRDADLPLFAAINADPEVMEFFPARLDRFESDAFVARIRDGFEANGFGLWALEVRETGELVGFTGISIPRFEAHFTPCVEIGWRLSRPSWGRGYASEAAHRALAFGFDEVGLDEIVSFAFRGNRRSISVMERLGMQRDEREDFDHPSLRAGDPLQPHVLYRVRPG